MLCQNELNYLSWVLVVLHEFLDKARRFLFVLLVNYLRLCQFIIIFSIVFVILSILGWLRNSWLLILWFDYVIGLFNTKVNLIKMLLIIVYFIQIITCHSIRLIWRDRCQVACNWHRYRIAFIYWVCVLYVWLLAISSAVSAQVHLFWWLVVILWLRSNVQVVHLEYLRFLRFYCANFWLVYLS